MNTKMAATIGIGASCLVERRRIWQIDTSMHCSVLGTCLSLSDLHTIARRGRYHLDPGASAYSIHSWFVDLVAYANPLSKLVDKELEKRHRVAATRLRRAHTEEELEAGWKEVARRGDIAGAYWAAMSHPLCSNSLQWRLFGDIHMLSHLVGASRSTDVCRLHELEVTSAALEGKLAQLKHNHRAVLEERKRLEDELGSLRHERERSERRLIIAHDKIAALSSATLVSQLEARVAALGGLLGEAQTRASAAESSLSDMRALLEEARVAAARSAEQVLQLTAENEALEAELEASVVCPLEEEDHEDDDGEDIGLRGKRILCVGGRSSLVQHYRALVERRGGEFLHHDGGLEDSLDAVTRALSTVDAVLCPVDCVSHAACLKVKRACKHLAKRFIPLRSSGLSSFARGIQAIAQPRSPAPSTLAPTAR